MSKTDKSTRSGFVIKLSCETAQKLAEEEHLAKCKKITASEEDDLSVKVRIKDETDNHPDTNLNKEDFSTEVSKSDKESSDKKRSENQSGSAERIKVADKEHKPYSTPGENAENPKWGDYAPYVSYEGEQAIYTEPTTQQKYIWNKTTNSWDPQGRQSDEPGRVYSYEDDTHIYTESDGSKFFWDVEKKAWIPKVDDDFLAYYQMSYGFVDNTSKEQPNEDTKKKETQKEKKGDSSGVKRKNEPQWFEPSEETNTKVYVSNLPLDMTEEEFVNLMQKCGLVERDPSTQKMKVKLYMDKEHNCFKGDALCTYIKIESVDLALKLLDGSDYKGNKIKVEKAHFQLKGEYNPALKPKKKKKKELEKIKKMQQKLFDWRPEKFVGERSKHERVVIVKNLFHPSDFDKEVQLILDYQQDLREECSKCGDVRKVVIYDRHPEGVAQITMKEPEQADAVIQLINGRWFGKRQITAEIWDGRTKYRIAETDADLSKRVDKWDKFLEGKEDERKTEDAKQTKGSTQSNVEEKMSISVEESVNLTEDKSDKVIETEDKESPKNALDPENA